MPNRIIKEAIRTSKDVNNLNDFQFRVWTYLITYVDDYGRGSADPELLKGLVFPRRKGITEKQIGEALSVLASSGMINLYQVDGEPYFYFPTWEKHQTVRATKSKFPEPQTSEQVQATASRCKQAQADVPVIQSYSYSESESIIENDNAVLLTQNSSAGEGRTDYQSVAKAYNEICVPPMPQVQQLSEDRKKHIKTGSDRLKKAGLSWQDYFSLAAASDFLMGRDGRWPNCGFDWLIGPKNMLKVLEGNYANRSTASQAQQEKEAAIRAWEERHQ